jgi:D-aminopeptidase
MIKSSSLFILLTLFSWMLNSCGMKKTYPYDRFGGGISVDKPMHNSTKTIAEKIPDLVSEKSTQNDAETIDSRLHASEKQQQKIKSAVQDMSKMVILRPEDKLQIAIKNKIYHRATDHPPPKKNTKACLCGFHSGSAAISGYDSYT